MKKKRIASKLLSLMLSAAVIVSSSFSGITLTNVSATQVPAEEAVAVSDNTVDDATDIVETDVDMTEPEETDVPESDPTEEEQTAEDTLAEEEAGEPQEETVEEETVTSGSKVGETEDEEVKPDKKETDESLLMKNLVADATLETALVTIYNDTIGSATAVTVDTMTMGNMKKLEIIDLSSYKEIADISGLTYAENATQINLAGTKVKMIPANEFQSFSKLTAIVLPDELEGIGDFAFQNCTALESIDVSVSGAEPISNTLPSSLKDTSTGSNIFNGCSKLTEINIPNFDEGMEAALQKAASIFANCTSLATVNVAPNVSNIPGSAFEGAGPATGMTITFAAGSEMKMLSSGAFKNANLSSIDLSNCGQLAEIGDSCFSAVGNQKVKLTEIKMPSSTTSATMKIGKDAFYKAPLAAMYTGEDRQEGLISIPNYVTSLGAGAFYNNTTMTSLVLSFNMQEIAEYTFDGCTSLAEVSFTEGITDCQITRIGNAAFRKTTALTNAAFVGEMNRLTRIGDEKLSVVGDSNVKELNYVSGRNNNLKYGSDVFRGSGITSIVFPASLRVINSRSFYKTEKLQTVAWKSDPIVKNQVYEINSEAFSGCLLLDSFVYTNATGASAQFTIDQYAFQGCSKLRIFSEEGMANTDGTSNALPRSLIKLGKRAFADCASLPAMSIKNREDGSCPTIAEEVFYKAFALAKAELPAAITQIPKGMYYDAALVELPSFEGGVNKVQKIGDYAFFGNRIQTVDLSGWSKLTAIGDYGFAYTDTALNPVYYSDDRLAPPMVKMILADAMPSAGNMSWGNAMLKGASNFTTLSTVSWSQDGVVYIPNYIKESGCGAAVLEGTGVTKAYWGFLDVVKGANVWYGIPDGMFFNTKVSELTDCCLPDEYLIEIGEGSYASCDNLTTVDLSQYLFLETTGDGAFANCKNVTKVVLPDNGLYTKTSKNMFRAGFFAGMATGPISYKSSIKEIDFGGVEELGDYCFATANEKADSTVAGSKATDVWPSALATLDLKNSYVKKIGTGAFKGNSGLETADFGIVENIGISAFEQCENLNLTGVPMSDSISVIGNRAFYRCSSLGTVVFGAGLTQIGVSAFELCAVVDNATSASTATTMDEGTGLTAVDFSKAKDLATIGNYAFRTTGLTKLDLSATAVKNLGDGASTFADNPYLTEVKLGEAMQRVGQNVFSGCVRMNYFSFYSTTTMNKAAFKNKGKFKDESGDKTTPISKVGFEVKPVELNVGLGRPMKFPYYVNEYVQNQTVKFDEMYIGNAGNTDSTICKYVKVSAATTGYYLNEVDGQAITDSRYFEQVTDSTKMVMSINGKKVTAFEIEGLEATPEGVSIPFTVTNNFNFESADSDNGISKKMTTTFQMKVMEIPYYPVIYTDTARTMKENTLTLNEKTGLTTGTTEFRVEKTNTTGRKTFWYDIKTMVKSNWQPESGNLIIHTSDPSIVVSTGTKVGSADDTWMIKAEYTANTTMVSDITKGKSFALIPKGHGDAIVTIYPENCPEKKVTWKIQVRADIKKISLSIPKEYMNGQYVGASFPVVQSMTNYLGQTVYYKDNGLKDYKKYTDNTLICGLLGSSFASIDEYGVVTIHKMPKKSEPLICIAYTISPLGEKLLEQQVTIILKYMQLRANVPVYADNGVEVKMTKAAKGNAPAEVTYVAPVEGATSVTIPATMDVLGIKCKVTAIDPAAFAGNKTLKSVTIGKNITSIPVGAFKGCIKLTTVNFKGKVTEIGDSAFQGCSALKKITIPKTVTRIGKKAFYNCKNLTTVTFKTKSKLVEIGDSAFQRCKAMKKITIPSTKLATIGKKAFYNCSKLNKIVVKSKVVTTVGKNAFKGIAKKAVIDVPNGKLGTYKTLFKKGQGKKVKIK